MKLGSSANASVSECWKIAYTDGDFVWLGQVDAY